MSRPSQDPHGEGSLEAPTRHPIPWQDPAFYDAEALEAEMRRVFDICHTCRRCFNLCESFPRLFDLVDQATDGEVTGVASADLAQVVDACTLCDMCYMTKCPYVPPHTFDVDFPHLMLRARAVTKQKEGIPFAVHQMTQTDRNGKIGCAVAPLTNWATATTNTWTRPLLEKVAGIDRRAQLPSFAPKTLRDFVRDTPLEINDQAPGWGEKVALYATCFGNYNQPAIGEAALRVLAHNGVDVTLVYPECCGMPRWEQGAIDEVAGKAQRIKGALMPFVAQGYQIVSLVPSCTLMIQTEWPLVWPEDSDIQTLAAHTFDIADYLVDLGKRKGLMTDLKPIPGGVNVHVACHARAQNRGRKGEALLKLIPETPLYTIERCSGHGGSFGICKGHFDVALKVGQPVVRHMTKHPEAVIVSECPLAAKHIVQGVAIASGDTARHVQAMTHPVEVLAYSYGFSQP